MRRFIYLLIAFSCLFATYSCNEEWDSDELLKSPMGQLYLGNLNFEISQLVDDDSCVVAISNIDGTQIYRWQVFELPSFIELSPGTYKFDVSSVDSDEPQWEVPMYKGTQTFKIKEKETTEISSVACDIASVAVSVGFQDDVVSLIDASSIVVVDVAGKSLDFAIAESRRAHFALFDDAQTVVAKFIGKVNGEDVEGYKIVTDIKAGDELTLVFSADDLVKGPLPNDPNTPSVTSGTLNLEDVNIITEGLQAKVDILAPYGISNLYVKIVSDALTKELLQDVGLDSEFDLAYPGELAESLAELGFPVGEAVVGKTQLLFDISEFMPLLALFPGQHNFILTVVDKKGLMTEVTLRFEVPAEVVGAAPQITSETLNLNGVNIITEELQAKVDIIAENGISNLYVKIVSDALTKELLQDVGLDSEFDLANPGGLAEPLAELGFPVGEAVVGKTQLLFDISEFMPLLALFPGQHNFVLTVVDAQGLSSEVTLKFEVPTEEIGKGPQITSETLDLDGVNTITEDLQAKVDIIAENGILNLHVKIVSESLTKELLQDVGLDSEFDLANPRVLAEPLSELGFPVGDAVLGKTQLPFDISEFMPLLMLFPGQHSFVLTVVDAENLSVTKTLKFQAI